MAATRRRKTEEITLASSSHSRFRSESRPLETKDTRGRGSPKGYLLLILPLLTLSLSAQQVKEALEHCSFEQVESWFQDNFGRSALAKRRAAFQSS
jgi:hypothetical protein